MIDKWLNAGVLEDGLLRHATEGSPQGGVVSPCLSNIFLHYVLDEWFENEVKPRLKGRSTLVRFTDDAVMAFEDFLDTTRVLGVLGKRFGRYELKLHPDKTRFVDFRFKRPDGKAHPKTDGTTFTFLGFCHVWGKSQNAYGVRGSERSVLSFAGIKPIRESLYGLTFADERKRARWLEDMRGHGERGRLSLDSAATYRVLR